MSENVLKVRDPLKLLICPSPCTVVSGQQKVIRWTQANSSSAFSNYAVMPCTNVICGCVSIQNLEQRAYKLQLQLQLLALLCHLFGSLLALNEVKKHY